MLRHRFYVLILLLIFLVTFGSTALPTYAQSSATNISVVRVTCNSITVRYTLPTTTGINAILLAEDASGTYVGSAIGPNSAGTYTTTVSLYSPVPDGTRLRVEIGYGGGFSYSSRMACSASSTGREDEPLPPPPWEGLFDGRINADPAEYYTIFCALGDVQVYRTTPGTELLTQVAISTIASMSIGDTLDLGNFMTLVRNTEDTVTIYGSNGNLAPEPGSKAFSLAACMDEAEFVESIVDAPETTVETYYDTYSSDDEVDDLCVGMTGPRWASCAYIELRHQGLVPRGSGLFAYLLLLAFSCLLPAGGLVLSPMTITIIRRHFIRREKQ